MQALDGGSVAREVGNFYAGFSSLKAAGERTGKQWEINDFPAAGGRAEVHSEERGWDGKDSVRSAVLAWGNAETRGT